MSYLNDYLKVIPTADASKIRTTLNKSQEYFEISRLSDQAFEELLEKLVVSEEPLTKLVDPGTKITADPLNRFYGNVLLDLTHLFSEQNAIERAGENYDIIYQSQLDELKKEIEALERKIALLEETRKGESGLVLKSFSFEPEKAELFVEPKTVETAYLFADRDGRTLESAIIDRHYHTYFLSLAKNKEIDLLKNEKGLTTASMEVLYESPYTLKNNNEQYGIEKAIDGDNGTFWFNVALKPNNALDSITISQKGRP